MEGGSVHRMCRCCAAEGSFKDIKTTYHWMGDEEVYGDMLSECFDVKLITSDHGGICEMCITHLRNAANFKKQVLETEEQFRKHLESGKFNRPPVVKQEFTMDDEMGESDDNMDNGEDDDYVPDFEVPIKTEDELDEPVKPRKRACKATTSRAKKSKAEEKSDSDSSSEDNIPLEGMRSKTLIKTETDVKDAETGNKTEENQGIIIKMPPPPPQKGIKRKTAEKVDPKPKKDANKTFITIGAAIKLPPPPPPKKVRRIPGEKKISEKVDLEIKLPAAPPKEKKVVKKRIPKQTIQVELEIAAPEVNDPMPVTSILQLEQHKNNAKVILQYTNAIPIGNVDRTYGCCFCNEEFQTMASLKEHTTSNHATKNKYMQESYFYSHIAVLDISDLACNICNFNLRNIEEAFDHLTGVHNKTLNRDIPNRIIGIRSDDFQCVNCEMQCASFTEYIDHMNSHYGVLSCPSCNQTFITEKLLADHKVIHDPNGPSTNASTASTMGGHRCPICGEKFKTKTQKCYHMTQTHNVSFEEQCMACLKSFKNKVALKLHIDRDHLMEKKFECTYCDKRFFASGMLKSHIVTHTGERDFKCGVCGKKFLRKKNLNGHMKVHKH